MYRIFAPTEKSKYDLGELAKEFLLPEEFAIFTAEEDPSGDFDLIIPDDDSKFVRGRALYDFLVKETGKTVPARLIPILSQALLISDLLFNLGSLTDTVAQIIQLSAADSTTANDLDVVKDR